MPLIFFFFFTFSNSFLSHNHETYGCCKFTERLHRATHWCFCDAPHNHAVYLFANKYFADPTISLSGRCHFYCAGIVMLHNARKLLAIIKYSESRLPRTRSSLLSVNYLFTFQEQFTRRDAPNFCALQISLIPSR